MSKARELAELGAVYNDGALSNRNLIYNGAMQVAQRGTSFTITSGGGYSLDRFYAQSDVGSGHTWAQVSDVPSSSGFEYSGKVTVGTGATPSGSNFGRIIYYVEGYDAQQTCFGSSDAKAVTLSFWTKSSVAGTFGGSIKMQFASPFSGFFFTYTINATNTWEHKTVTIPAGTITGGSMSGSNGIGLLVAFDLGEGPDRSTSAGYQASPSGGVLGVTGATKILATSSATWQITGLQLELGTEATPFEYRTFADELARCQRYFCQPFDGVATHSAMGVGRGAGGGAVVVWSVIAPVPMRTTPTMTSSGSYYITDHNSRTIATPTAVQISQFSPNSSNMLGNYTFSTSVCDDDRVNMVGANTAVKITLDAEL